MLSHLPLLLIIGMIAILLVAVAAVLKAKQRGGEETPTDPAAARYELRSPLFSPAERSFAGVLDGALPDGVTWLAKVRLGDVFKPQKGLTASQRATASNRIDRKHVDFLLIRSSDLAPVGGIELDDASHDEPKRQARDAFVDEVFKSAALPLLHVPAQAAYNRTELRNKIAALFSGAEPQPPTTIPARP